MECLTSVTIMAPSGAAIQVPDPPLQQNQAMCMSSEYVEELWKQLPSPIGICTPNGQNNIDPENPDIKIYFNQLMDPPSITGGNALSLFYYDQMLDYLGGGNASRTYIMTTREKVSLVEYTLTPGARLHYNTHYAVLIRGENLPDLGKVPETVVGVPMEQYSFCDFWTMPPPPPPPVAPPPAIQDCPDCGSRKICNNTTGQCECKNKKDGQVDTGDGDCTGCTQPGYQDVELNDDQEAICVKVDIPAAQGPGCDIYKGEELRNGRCVVPLDGLSVTVRTAHVRDAPTNCPLTFKFCNAQGFCFSEEVGLSPHQGYTATIAFHNQGVDQLVYPDDFAEMSVWETGSDCEDKFMLGGLAVTGKIKNGPNWGKEFRIYSNPFVDRWIYTFSNARKHSRFAYSLDDDAIGLTVETCKVENAGTDALIWLWMPTKSGVEVPVLTARELSDYRKADARPAGTFALSGIRPVSSPVSWETPAVWIDPGTYKWNDLRMGVVDNYGMTFYKSGGVIDDSFRLISGNESYDFCCFGDRRKHEGDAWQFCKVQVFHIRPGDRDFLDTNKCSVVNSPETGGADLYQWLSAEEKDQVRNDAVPSWPQTPMRLESIDNDPRCSRFNTID